MDDEDAHFDVLLGGTEKLPSSLNLAKFVACRSQEIQIMKNSLSAQSGTKLVFQTIPKHMRRRAMSHNVKRLPRRLRQIHLNQMKKSGMPAKQKRPSRKYRRRPKNLMEEYTKRSTKKYRWLQTHIWHAKRFHMIQKWGYKLPHRPCDKAFRACYRAMSKHCLLQDISYYNCVEIAGDQRLIIERLKPFTTAHNGLGIGSKAFIQGNREGEVTLYETEDTPFKKAIGNVHFHWRPLVDKDISKLWVWVHTAFYDSVKTMFEKVFGNSSNVYLTEVGTDLCRFRLTGPLAISVLHDTFQIINGERAVESVSFKEYISTPENREIIMDQSKYWDQITQLQSTSHIPPHSILSIVVKDPRLNFPKKRTKSVGQSKHGTSIINLPVNISQSLLWDNKFRKSMNENKIPDSQIAEMQSKLIEPGLGSKEIGTFISIIIIQRPGNKTENIGWGGGLDVILPSVWAKTFWIAFVMRGARVGGLREFNSMLFEMGRQQILLPDTKAGINEQHHLFQENVENFFKKPPSKRMNYNKFKIASPFVCNWKILLRDWNGSTADFSVVREKKILCEIDLFLKSKIQILSQFPKNCLIPVKLECVKKGAPSHFAIICLPQSHHDFKGTLTEPTCVDELQKQRKELRQVHQSLLKKFRKQRKLKPDSFKQEVYHEQMRNFTKKIRALWLPEPTTIRKSCSREVIGFITTGGFSFSTGKGCGTGYIVSDCLPELLKFKNRILFRNTNSRQYKEAKMFVIIE